ncbi:aldolase [Dendrothele bispora CBS 962.96]|uniref:fructose-bisphosphate aldolase n=1 Tax=Dendrothele bispora (strain CBS 962.96) TaxID=1314807 RepID=A0A4S8MNK2_DENBC|nr:aldolase [Dendrothele bispora CBS 962.96]
MDDDSGSTVPNTFSSPHNLFSVTDHPQEQGNNGFDTLLLPHHSVVVAKELTSVAQALVSPRGKGIYATDESPDVVEGMLVAASLNGQENFTDQEKTDRRRKWREAAYSSLTNDHISGVILYPETLLEFKLGESLSSKGIILGVRANGELAPFPASPFEFIVQGLDDLLPRMQAARAAGARFSKWRAPIACTSPALGLPSQVSLEVQAETMAIFASVSQQAGLVPIIEPDIEFSADADLYRSVEIHQKIIRMTYARCLDHGVFLEGTLIKPSFPQPGLKHPTRKTTTSEDIALATATVLANSVPTSVPGVVFLSGGLEPAVAMKHLSALNALVNKAKPGSPFARLPPLSFSYGRALQGEAMKHWVRGDIQAMKNAFDQATKGCFMAARGEY